MSTINNNTSKRIGVYAIDTFGKFCVVMLFLNIITLDFSAIFGWSFLIIVALVAEQFLSESIKPVLEI